MVTNTYSLDDINDGYQDMLDGKNIRGVIKFDRSGLVEPLQHRLDHRAERPQLRGGQPVEHHAAHQLGVPRRGGLQRRTPAVGQLDGRAAPVVAAAVALDQAAATHPAQLMRQPALLPRQDLAEFVDPLRPAFRQRDQHVVVASDSSQSCCSWRCIAVCSRLAIAR